MTRVAAIDVGTNTVRLLVADAGGSRLTDVERVLEITRLGRGVDADRRLRPDAIERTAEVVAAFADRARGLGAVEVRAAGTSALRDAHNSGEFAAAVRAAAGLDLEVLSGEDEGRTAFVGATHSLGDAGPFLVCDIGGGSTEFIRGRTSVEAVWSADVGSVRLRERYLTSDPPTRGELDAARDLVDAELLQVEREVGLGGDETLVGVAGTATTVAALVLGLDRYDAERVHGSRLPAGEVSAWAERLASMRVEDVRELPSMDPRRADVIASGALILRRVVERWGFPEVLVSERDILDGLILDMVL